MNLSFSNLNKSEYYLSNPLDNINLWIKIKVALIANNINIKSIYILLLGIYWLQKIILIVKIV